MKRLLIVAAISLAVIGCNKNDTQTTRDAKAVERQQSQISKSQPVPAYNWSLERHLVIELYNIRNQKAMTHSVWRSDRGVVEGDCASIGFGIPYDTSLTNPLTAKRFGLMKGSIRHIVEQPEPNSIFASKNTSATWVMCSGKMGNIEPVYVETKVTTYPYPVLVDYETNRVKRNGKSSVSIEVK